jgi:hypothetical protein
MDVPVFRGERHFDLPGDHQFTNERRSSALSKWYGDGRNWRSWFLPVNPPLHKLVSGIAVRCLDQEPLAGIYNASSLQSGLRNKFRFAETVLASRGDN